MKACKMFIAAAALVAAGYVATSCGNRDAAGAEQTETAAIDTVRVDVLMTDPAAHLGDTIAVSGVCSHLCKHGGRKAFITPAGCDSVILRCDASDSLVAFSPDCVGKSLTVTGIVCETRFGEEDIKTMEARHAENAAATHACATDAKARGIDSVSTFEQEMCDYRAAIAKRLADEGKDYLSFYYIDAISYVINE